MMEYLIGSGLPLPSVEEPLVLFKLPNGKIIGKKVLDMLVLERQTKLHYYVKGGGYPANNEMLHHARALGLKEVRIVEYRSDGSRHVYACALDKYLNAVMIHELGFEPQRCVPLKELTKLEE